jgi:hypothetical protein
LTKQNYGLCAIAGVAGLLAARRWRDAVLVAALGAAVTAAVLTVVTLVWEPGLAQCFFEEGQFPYSWANWRRVLLDVARASPDLLLVPLFGLVWWLRHDGRDVQLATVAGVFYVVNLAWAGKFGADLNYFLNLQTIVGIGAGSLWTDALGSTVRRAVAHCFVVAIGILSVLATTAYLAVVADTSRQQAYTLTTWQGHEFLSGLDKLLRIARNPTIPMLTDSDFIALYQGERAAFMDGQDFRVMAENGRIDPTRIQDRLDRQTYDLVVLSSDIHGPDYATYYRRLPDRLASSVRQNYVYAGPVADYFVYLPVSKAARTDSLP